MKFIRCKYNGKASYAVLENGLVKLLAHEPYDCIEFTGEIVPLTAA